MSFLPKVIITIFICSHIFFELKEYVKKLLVTKNVGNKKIVGQQNLASQFNGKTLVLGVFQVPQSSTLGPGKLYNACYLGIGRMHYTTLKSSILELFQLVVNN